MSWLLASVAPAALPAPVSEEAILGGIKLPDGYVATVFARPPEVVSPAAVFAAPDGAIFVAIDENGSISREPDRGRVVRCIDSDDDGVADNFSVLARMDSPRGVIWDGARGIGSGTLYVVHPPKLSAYTDADGDGTLDHVETLVEGLGYDLSFRGADHTTNGCRLGIDGWIYIAVGDYGFTAAKGRDGGVLELRGGGIVRVRPDGTGLEIVSRGQRNIYDVGVSPTLDLFTRDNTNDGGGWNVRLTHVPAGSHLGYPTLFKNFPEDMLPPLADFGGGSPTGALWLDEPGLPSGLLTVEWGAEGVMRHELVPDGAGWRLSVRAPEGGQEKWLSMPRPTDIDADAAGNLYISSWAGGKYTFTPDIGYILRVSKAGTKVGTDPLDIASSNDDQVLAMLGSRSAALRLAAQRELLRRGDRSTTGEKIVALAERGEAPAVRVAAVETLKLLRGAGAIPQLVRWAGDPLLREHAIRALGDDARWSADVPDAPLAAALRDDDPRVRRQAITAVRRLHKTTLAAVLFPQVGSGDPVLSHLAVRALRDLRAVDVCFAALDAADERVKPGALRVLYGVHEPQVVEGLVSRLATADRELRRGIVHALCRLVYQEAPYKAGTWWGTRPDTSGPVFEAVRWSQSDKIQAVLAREFVEADAEHARWLVAELVRTKVDFPGFAEAILRRAGDDPEQRLTAIESLVRRDHSMPEEALASLRALASDRGLPGEMSVRAVRLLQANIDDAAVLRAALDVWSERSEAEAESEPLRALRDEFIRDVRHLNHLALHAKRAVAPGPREREISLAVLVNLSTSRVGRRAALAQAKKEFERLWQREEIVPELLAAIGRVRALDHAAAVRARLAHPDPAVAHAAEQALRLLGVENAERLAATIGSLSYEQAVAAAMGARGSPAAGREVFLRAACVACHTVDPGEPPKGPPLWGIATRYSRAQVLEAILKPAATIAQGFDSQWFSLADGREVSGFVTRESGDAVDLRDITGQSLVLAKSEIKQRGKHETSMMPAGLLDGFTTDELGALLTYLESLSGH